MKKTVLIFLVLLVLSPWFWMVIRNFRIPGFFDERFIAPSNVLEEVNTLQNQGSAAGFGIAGKLLVNKPTFLFKNTLQRYLESFDPAFLFFKGDLNIRKTTGSEGALFVVLLPLILYEVYQLVKEKKELKKRIFFTLLFLAPLPSAVVYVHYDTISKIPLLLVLTFLAAGGLARLLSTKRVVALFLIFLLFFEFVRFSHDFSNHYPNKLEKGTASSETV